VSDLTIRVGLLGAGGINRIVATAAREGRLPGIRITAVAGSSPDSQTARETAALVDATVVEAAALAGYSDWVLEAAGRRAAVQYAPLLWSKGVNTVLMSIGAMLDPEVEEAAARYRRSGGSIVLPSGAIAGLDGIRAMAADGGLQSVSLTTIKSPASLAGAPFLLARGAELSD
jgi:aspartate dehydrogenase